MTREVELEPGDGAVAKARFAEASGKTGVVVVHEFRGLDDSILGTAEKLAASGFPALAVDLYRGRVASTREEAAALREALDPEYASAVVEAGARELKKRGVRHVAVAGFCLGGAVALRAAADAPSLDAAVVFYGLPDAFDPAGVRVPLLLHFANADDWCTPERVHALEESLRRAGKPFQLHRYDAGHAFMNETREGVYDAQQAALAWQRTIAFLART